jgi:diguanylate cyclase (GGDEF)-like protein
MHYLQRNPERLHGLFRAIKSLDSAISNHESWLSNLFRRIVCNEPFEDSQDARENAHRYCKFGEWYYEVGDIFLAEHPMFVRIGRVHQQMHDAARKVLMGRAETAVVSAEHYDAFTELTMTFKLEIRNLQFELLNRLCTVDHLTGLWNRHSMHFRITQERERVNRTGRPSCIALMDVDHFKAVNDDYGHPAGDHVLRELAAFFALRIRKYDAMFRYGGEEFLLCLSDVSIEDAVTSMDRLRLAMSEMPLALPDGHSVTVTVSMGITELVPDKSVDDAIQEADHALLCAKARGRNRICPWADDLL